MTTSYPLLERFYLKRMTITDYDLTLLENSFLYFKELVMVCCDGFNTCGLTSITRKCRKLTTLDLNENEIHANGEDWLACFPETLTSLRSLCFDCLEVLINFDALERLVAKCSSLKKLRLNRNVSIVQLQRLIIKAPQLTHLGTSSFFYEFQLEQVVDLLAAFSNCKQIQCLLGFREVVPEYLPAVYQVFSNLTSLNFIYDVIASKELEGIVCHCRKLQLLWVLDSVGDKGLEATTKTCKDLRDLHVFPMDACEDGEGCVSE